MKKLLLGLAASVLLAATSPASAVALLPSFCPSASSAHGCLYLGNISTHSHTILLNGYHDAQNEYNLWAAINPSVGPSINLNFITSANDADFSDFGAITGGKSASGTWTLSGYLVDFIAVEASNFSVLYAVDGSSGDWNTLDIPSFTRGLGNTPKETNILFFGSEIVDVEGGVALPEPSSWVLLLMGFLGLGTLLRTHRSRPVASVA